MEEIRFKQGTSDWVKARLGIITASNFSKVLAKGQGKTRDSYIMKIISERITGEAQESYSNASMEWGVYMESEAKSAYEITEAAIIKECGFFKLNDWIGASPDGLIGDDGLIEIKCPNTSTHLKTVIDGEIPGRHLAQIQGQLYVTNRKWCDFVSYDPRVKSKESYFCKRMPVDMDYIQYTLVPALKELIEDAEKIMSSLIRDNNE